MNFRKHTLPSLPLARLCPRRPFRFSTLSFLVVVVCSKDMNCSPPSAETPRPEYSSSSTLTQRPPEYSSSSNGQHRQVSSPTSPVQELGSFSPPSFMLASEYSPAPWIYTYEASVADASIRVPNSVGSDVEFESSGPSALDSAKPSRAESSLLFQHTGTTGLTREGNLSNSSDSRLLNAVSDGRATLSNTPPKIPVKDRVKLRRTCDYCKSKKVRANNYSITNVRVASTSDNSE